MQIITDLFLSFIIATKSSKIIVCKSRVFSFQMFIVITRGKRYLWHVRNKLLPHDLMIQKVRVFVQWLQESHRHLLVVQICRAQMKAKISGYKKIFKFTNMPFQWKNSVVYISLVIIWYFPLKQPLFYE